MSEADNGSGQPSQFGYWDNDNWVDTTPQQALTSENLSSAYQNMFGREAPQDWVQQTQAAYKDPNNTLEHVMYNAALGASTANTPYANVAGDTGSFTSGADYYQKQGFIPGGYTYEGVPTEFYDPKTGALVASYGSLQKAGENPKSTSSNAWQWNVASSIPKGYETARAIPRTDWNNAFQQGLAGAAFALSPVAAGMGASALGLGAGAGEAGLGTLGGAEAFPVTMGDSITMAPLGEAAAEAGAAGTAAELGSGWEGSADIMENVAQGETPGVMDAIKSWAAKQGIGNLLKYGLTGASLLGAAKGSSSGSQGVPSDGSFGLQSLAGGATVPTKFSWNYQQPTAPVDGKVYGQQILRPQYFAKGGDTGLAALRSESKVRHVDPEVVREIMDELEDYAPEERVPMFDNLPSKEEIVSFYLNHHPNIAGSEDYDPRMQGIEHAELGASAPIGEGSLSAGLHGLRIQNPPEYNEQGVNTAYNRSAVSGAGLGYEMPFAGGILRGDVSKNFSRPGVSGMLNYSKEFAKGGLSDLGGYSDGGRMLKGPGDGMSDSIPASIENKRPARLATDEFVVPADVVSHLGNGSSDAGAKVLYKMMDRVRQARTGNKKQGKQINPGKYLPG